MQRVDEFFTRSGELPNTMTSAPFYSRFHLSILHEAIRTLAGNDLALSPEARRWLEDDEYAVRERIHREMAAVLAEG